MSHNSTTVIGKKKEHEHVCVSGYDGIYNYGGIYNLRIYAKMMAYTIYAYTMPIKDFSKLTVAIGLLKNSLQS